MRRRRKILKGAGFQDVSAEGALQPGLALDLWRMSLEDDRHRVRPVAGISARFGEPTNSQIMFSGRFVICHGRPAAGPPEGRAPVADGGPPPSNYGLTRLTDVELDDLGRLVLKVVQAGRLPFAEFLRAPAGRASGIAEVIESEIFAPAQRTTE